MISGWQRAPWIVAALLLGGLVGVGIDKMPVSAPARGILAMVVAWNISLLVVSLGWSFASPMAGDSGVIPVAPRVLLITTVIAAVAGGILYYVLSHSTVDFTLGLTNSRTITLGALGSLAGVVHGLVAGWSDEIKSV